MRTIMPSNYSKLFLGFTLSLSLGLSGCGSLLDLLKPTEPIFEPGNRTVASAEPVERARPEPTAKPTNEPATPGSNALLYAKGELAGMESEYTQMSNSLAKTTAALLQAILTTNSFLYTDIDITSLETFQLRKTEADKALSLLETYAAETESILNRMNATMGSQSLQIKAAQSLRPEDVLATVSSGPANKQLQTLMQQYKVNAKSAKEILDNAMTGLSSQYNKQAEFYNTAARTATLVKEGAGLSLTLLGGVATAGGVTGTLSVLQAGKLLITGADAALKVSKAGVELITGKDLKQPTGTVGAVMTTLSDASEIIAFTDLFNWKDKADRISNVVNISLKANDVIQDGELNLGAHSLNLTKILRDLSDWIPTELPSTLSGSYKIAGKPVVVKTLPENLTQVIETLPETQRVDQTKIDQGASPTPSPTSNLVPSPSPSVNPSPSLQEQDLCKDFTFPGSWSLEIQGFIDKETEYLEVPGEIITSKILYRNIKRTLQVADDHTFTDSDGNRGTWSAEPYLVNDTEVSGWSVILVYENFRRYIGRTEEPGCQLKGKVGLAANWTALRN